MSYTVPSNTSLVMERASAVQQTITLVEGTRTWTDWVYGTNKVDSCLLGYFATLCDTAFSLTFTKAYNSATPAPSPFRVWELNTSTGMVSRADAAATTTHGRELCTRLGWDPARRYFPTTYPDPLTSRLLKGIWGPLRGHSGPADDRGDGFGVTQEAYDGTVYTIDLGPRLKRRSLVFDGLPVAYVRKRMTWPSPYIDEDALLADYSFETVMDDAGLNAGELVRLYDDSAAACGYLEAALSATQTSASVRVTSGTFAEDTLACINGEVVYIYDITGSGPSYTWELLRDAPRSHAVGAPFSAKRVNTYAPSGRGKISRSTFDPERKQLNADRWRLEIELVEAR